MKKKIRFVFMFLVMALWSCENTSESVMNVSDDAVSISETVNLVDPETDPNVQPFIITNADESGQLKAPPSSDWILVFSDEFSSFDSNKWNKTVSTKSRESRPEKGIADWWWKADHVSIADGKLKLKASKPDYNTMYCGSVDSKDKYEPLYGYMEARIAIAPVSEAVHTAFWLQGANQGNIDGSGSDGCEVDIFESPFSANKCQTALHWDGYGDNNGHTTQQWTATNLHTGYHIFALEWAPNLLKIFFDGDLKWTYTGIGCPNVKEWLWLSAGASFVDGDFINGTYPVYAYVDWVRVWQLPKTINLECENVSRYSPSGDLIETINHSSASGGKHVKLNANAVDDRIRFDNIYVGVPTTYTVIVSGLTWTNFGKYKCSITNNADWTYFSPVIDLYSTTSDIETVTFGNVYLDAGNHSMTMTCYGKNSSSSNYVGSFDKISLVPVN